MSAFGGKADVRELPSGCLLIAISGHSWRLGDPKSGHRKAAEGMQFPWRWNGDTISTNLDVIWGMSVQSSRMLAIARRRESWP